MSNKGKTGMSGTKSLNTKDIQPEDNWDLVANPSNYLDELP